MTHDPAAAVARSLEADPDALSVRSRLLFTQDEQGRLLRVRETDGARAPRFYLARGPLCNVWRFRADLPRELVTTLARLAGKERPLAGLGVAPHSSEPAGPDPWRVLPPPERVEAFRNALREHAEIEREYRGPAFRFPAVIPDPSMSAGELLRLDAMRNADRTLLRSLTESGEGVLADLATHSELLPQTDCFAIVLDGQVVSACWTSRFLPGVGAEAGIHTTASKRGRGFALRVVAAWACAMRASGTEPRYSTEWSNRASRAIARRLRLILCSEDLHFD